MHVVHFLKSLWKKAKHLELKSRLHKRHVALCASLALIPEQYINDGWLYIMEDCPQNNLISAFNDYFVENWLDNKTIARNWNVYGQRHRTTNLVESWHSKINRKINGRNKPNILQCLDTLHKEANLSKNKMDQVQRGVQTNNRTPESIENEARINRIFSQFFENQISLGHCMEKLCIYY